MTYRRAGRGRGGDPRGCSSRGSRRATGRHHAAQRDGLSGDPVRRSRGRLDGRQRQPALHPARADAASCRIAARGCCSCWRTSPTRSRRPRRPCARARGRGEARRSPRLQGRDRQFRVAAREEGRHAASTLRDAVAFADVLAEGAQATAEAVDGHARGCRVPAIYRRHDRRRQGRDAAPPQRRRERRAIRGLDAAVLRRAHRPRDGDGAAALPHLRADGVRASDDAARRLPAPDRQPARSSPAS